MRILPQIKTFIWKTLLFGLISFTAGYCGGFFFFVQPPRPSPWAQPTSTPGNQQDQTGQSQSCRCPIIIITKEGGRRRERHIPPDERRAVQRQTRRFLLQDQPPPFLSRHVPNTNIHHRRSTVELPFFFCFFYIPCQHRLAIRCFTSSRACLTQAWFFVCVFLLQGCFINSILASCSLTWFITHKPINQHSGYI